MQVLDTVDLDAIRALHQREEFFWLDLARPSDADLDALGAILGIPDLAIEDTKEFGQRPKIDDYGRPRAHRVLRGARRPTSSRSTSTCPATRWSPSGARRAPTCGRRRERAAKAKIRTEQDLVYRVLDALADSLRTLADRYARRGRRASRRSPSRGPSPPTAGA